MLLELPKCDDVIDENSFSEFVPSQCQSRIFNHPRDGGDCLLDFAPIVPDQRIEPVARRSRHVRSVSDSSLGQRLVSTKARWLCTNCEPKFRHPAQRYFPMDHCIVVLDKRGLKTRKLHGRPCKM